MNWEIIIDTYTAVCENRLASGKLLCTQEARLVLCDELEGWGEGMGLSSEENGRSHTHS